MRTGIIICGLNGSGKTTLGKALADKLKFHFIDSEDLFFSKTESDFCYAAPRTREEAQALLMDTIKTYKNFVLSTVKGNYGKKVEEYYKYAILITVPKNIRMIRVKERSYKKFGNRILLGGDLYEREEAFFNMVSSKSESYAEEWVNSLHCPIIRVDGTKPIIKNIDFILEQIIKSKAIELT